MEDEKDETVPDECMEELCNKNRTMSMYALVNSMSIRDVNHFSTKRRLKRVVAHVMLFIRSVKAGIRKDQSVDSQLCVGVMKVAHSILIRMSQIHLTENRQFISWKHQFGLYKDSKGVWRCHCGLENADLPFETKFPIFLKKQNHITSSLSMTVMRD